MATKKTTFILLCLILAFAKPILAQQTEFLNNLQQYGAAMPQEKVYLHLDKPHYLTGDDIWLKGYVTFGVQNQLSALSKILYIDLIDPSNKVINQTKLLILHGVTIGDLHLVDTLKQGTYHLRAYTNWMRNLPEETFFNKEFTIGRVQDATGTAQNKPAGTNGTKQAKSNSISFMPEGGNMVAGLQSRVAFKMLQPDGFAAGGSGYVTDDTGEKLAEFTAGYAGMGSFFLTPQAGKAYKAVVTYTNGTTQTTNLPAALPEGFVLTLLPHLPVNVLLAIKTSPALVKNQNVTILVQKQGKVIYAGQKVINAPESLTRLPLDKFPSGIIQVTLFNENMQPLCERLFFNLNPHTALPLTASLDNQQYKNRQQVMVTLKAGEDADSLRNGTFSAAVVNLGGLPQLKTNQSGILPGLLLTPELKGYVENPDHYFEVFDNDRMTELDNLILCQGWRRIVWEDVKAGKMPMVNFQPEKSFTISGTVTSRNGTPAANVKVSLLSVKSYMGIDTVTDAKGRYVFNNLLLNENNRFSVTVHDDKRNLILKVDPQPGVSSYTPLNNGQPIDDATYQAYLKTAYKQLPDSVKQRLGAINLKEVNITTTRSKSKMVPAFSANRNGAGNADEIFLADEMKYSMTLKQFLQGRAMGVKFIDDSAFVNRADNFLTGQNAPKPMTIMLDGVELHSDGDAPLNWIPVEDVASIEILRTAATSALYGGNNGVIIITTKTGKSELHYPSKPSPGTVPLIITGYHAIREFYAPNYTVNPSAIPDHRTTIYWKPDIVTDKAGNATFKFYTTDDKGTYQITIEGITADGRPAHVVKSFTVE
ncbi:carboxypeptidase-like regulatory domain-containing protein [Mucilaginibacter boryungensis]|uniref:TonB-dependent receptor plug domain-containing protein n=1 Tax=Mucilaginibacter boryungensis TaxID=768480 RepID=A0ABR9XEW4_9SPHI|nr:carboxypeptidase-like regulatory domain-containing protein [Mucilaginibacter boryungensis]MBE9665619.1 TonB-dependent receptor plug domain-containing protein [Mucilaginibacter boryungensis]